MTLQEMSDVTAERGVHKLARPPCTARVTSSDSVTAGIRDFDNFCDRNCTCFIVHFYPI
jgi:hypothetical protein